MATSFASRLSGMKKAANEEEKGEGAKLTLQDAPDRFVYEPSSGPTANRPSRLLKGKIEKTSENDVQFKEKLVINDYTEDEIKSISIEKPKNQPIKRVIITKEQPKVQPKMQTKVQHKGESKTLIKVQSKVEYQSATKPTKVEMEEQPLDKPIHEEEMEESQAENESDLVVCPEGCGRKFNRKALEKHAKACKLVFMSKRKQFNSEAKRITSKEQAVIVKQNKIKEKKELGGTRGKFQKTGDNWKIASEDFRSAIKAMKEDGVTVDKEEENPVVAICEYCERQFNQLLLAKHKENCMKRKEKEKEKQRKKVSKK